MKSCALAINQVSYTWKKLLLHIFIRASECFCQKCLRKIDITETQFWAGMYHIMVILAVNCI